MAFVRVKSLKKSGGMYDYAYLVTSRCRKRRRKGWSSRVEQKCLGYLGRVFSFEEAFSCDFEDYFDTVDLVSVVGLELFKRGFVFRDSVYENSGVVVDLKRRVVSCFGRDCCVRLGEGILCSHSLEEIFGFSRIESKAEGLLFLKKLLKAGIRPDADVFGKLVEGMG